MIKSILSKACLIYGRVWLSRYTYLENINGVLTYSYARLNPARLGGSAHQDSVGDVAIKLIDRISEERLKVDLRVVEEKYGLGATAAVKTITVEEVVIVVSDPLSIESMFNQPCTIRDDYVTYEPKIDPHQITFEGQVQLTPQTINLARERLAELPYRKRGKIV